MPHLNKLSAKFLPDLGQKWQKTDYFQKSHKIDSHTISVFID